MHRTSATLAIVAFLVAMGAPVAAHAQTAPAPAAGAPKSALPAAAPSGAMVDGEVRKVDLDAKKITLKHGDIPSLDMPPMTMVFQVKDATMLRTVKAGDKVRFSAVKSTGGALVVTELEVVK